ncbi:NAD(P)-binding protein [Meredithblackwellia eburnea MCA 4105]
MPSLPTETKVIRLANPPLNEVEDSTWALSTEPLTTPLPPASILVQVIYYSCDPAQRGWIQKDVSAHRLYVKPVRKGDIMACRTLVKVIASTSEKWKEGTILIAAVGWVEYAILAEGDSTIQPTISEGLPSPTYNMSVLGTTSLTAWFGLHEIGNVTKDTTLVVSGAAGATGSAVVEIAKNIIGCKRVIGIAGGEDKCHHVVSLGADVCVDYKSSTFEEDLAKALPDDAEVFFDNVGGNVLNSVLPHVKRYGTVVACGAIAAYNDRKANIFTNYFEVIANRIAIKGFIASDYMAKIPDTRQTLFDAYKAGKFKATGDHETIRETKFEDIPKVWQTLFTGGNKGKLLIKPA